MKEFPRHILLMAFLCLIPALLSVFFLFALQPFGTSQNGLVRFLLYLLTQLLWLLPTCAFFAGLDRYRRGFPRAAYAILAAGLLLTAVDITLLFI
ncbi:MAG: hypothetical protein IJ684_07135 [Bacteroidales bacterium]|nr:hypothetical protein [Bacteroidales bacterium]